MNSIITHAPAKINWYLSVGAKRPDGYHDISTVMQTINLCDTLELKKANHREIRITVIGGAEDVPTDERNIVYKGAQALGIKGVDIRLEKRIPSQAGLGGGSSDCGVALCALNELFELGKSKAELAQIGASLGSDVPFFVYGGACIIGGMGERVTPLKPVAGYRIAIIKRSEGLSTRDVFNKFDSMPYVKAPALDEFVAGFSDENKNLHRMLFNSLEPAALELCPSIVEAKRTLEELGAVAAMMSGSGTSVFGLFDDEDAYLAAVEKNRNNCEFYSV